jgi:hypothetical protein
MQVLASQVPRDAKRIPLHPGFEAVAGGNGEDFAPATKTKKRFRFEHLKGVNELLKITSRK